MKAYYQRQALMLGEDAQEKLQAAHVLIVGCGALGSACAHYLARMGVGKLTLIDGDTVEEHNLARQHLYTPQDIGTKKATALAQHLQELNSNIHIVTHTNYIATAKDLEQFSADLIIDGLDTHAIRRVIDSYARQQGLWWVHGAAILDKGTVVAFHGEERKYDDIYPENALDTHCADLGVLVTTTSIVAALQAELTLSILTEKPLEYNFHRVQGMSVTTYPVKKPL